VAPASFHHGFGVTGVTAKQKFAVNKILTQCHMATVNSGAKPSPNPAMLRAAFQSPRRFQEDIPKEATYPIIWDSGASISISPSREDFVGPLKTPSISQRIRGIAKGLKIEGQGHVMWAVHDTNGMLRTLKVPAYYVPRVPVRLLSTPGLLQTYKGETITMGPNELTLSGNASDPTKGSVIAYVDPRNNLPTSLAYRYDATTLGPDALTSTITEVNLHNHNLSEP